MHETVKKLNEPPCLFRILALIVQRIGSDAVIEGAWEVLYGVTAIARCRDGKG